ncbi:MAG TPA: fibronectin type III domain-containing protein [Verrucomicrobiae bacterium]|nr:fibronectin type III domain-containing protein [Verrucomicrobiae bacterium]
MNLRFQPGRIVAVAAFAFMTTNMHAATPLLGISSASKYIQYYGSDFSSSNLQVLSQFDVVVLHPSVSTLTPKVVATLKTNGVKYVLGYISIGEQPADTPILRGNGDGPVYCTTNGISTITYESNNVASFYVDEAWSNSIGAYVIRNNGQIDKNGTFGGAYIWPNDDWRWVINTQRIGGVPGTSLSNMSVAGLAQIAGPRVSDSDISRTNNFGMDGFFLDTLDTAGPFAGVGSYPWAAQEMQKTVQFIHDTYTNKVVFANRGLFFYNPLLVNPQFNVRPYAYSIRPYVHATLFESYMLDSSTCDTLLNPYVNDNKYDYARKINAEANRPDGFTMFCLDYQMNRGTNLYELALNETVSSNGWVEYLCPDGSLASVGTYALNHPRPTDVSAPVWDSTANAGIAGGDLSCPNSNTLSSNPTPPRIGIQSVTAGSIPGDVVVHWDVAMDQTPPVKYNIYQSSDPSFSSYVAYSNVVYQVGDGWSTDPTTFSANQYTIHGLAPGTYYFRVRAQDSATPSHEDTNTVTLSMSVVNTRYNSILTGDIAVDGDLSDWTPLASFGLQSSDFPTSATNPVDLAQLWMAHDATNLYVAYKNYWPTTNGLNAAYNLYLDTDASRSTGYRGGANNFPVGADYLLQGSTLYRYTGGGTDWSWANVGPVPSALAQSNAEFSVPRMWLGNPTQLDLFFFSDNTALSGGTLQAEYPSGAFETGGGGSFLTYQIPDVANPVASGSIVIDGSATEWAGLTSFGLDPQDITISTSNKLDLAQIWMAHDVTNFYVAYQNYAAIASNDLNWAYNLYLDVDGKSSTGFLGGDGTFPIGADYLLQGATIYQYTGTNGTDWSWSPVGVATWAAAESNVEFSFPRAWIANPSLVRLFFLGDNSPYGGSAMDLYPDNALSTNGGGGYFAYRSAEISNPVASGTIAINGSLADWSLLTSFGMQPTAFTPSTTNPVDLTQVWLAHSPTNLYVAYLNGGTITNGLNGAYNLYLDVDGNRSTGFRGGGDNFPIGAEYLLQGATLYQYTGATGTDWSWNSVGVATWATSGSNAELSLPRTWLGNPEILKLFFLDDNSSIGGTDQDAYPRSALNPGGGGTWLAYRLVSANLDLDSVGDGIPDWWRQMYFGGNGTTTNQISCAVCDADGTGQNNLFKYLAGLDPTNSTSVFRIQSISRQNNDMLIVWKAGGGRTNVLQVATTPTGDYSNAGPDIVVVGSGDAVTNCLDVGGATNNAPTRFYRIRLVP